MSNLIAAADIADFQRDGAICLRGVFAREWVEALRVGVARNFAEPGPYHHRYTPEASGSPADTPGGFYDDYCNWQRIAEYEDFLRHSPAAEIAGRLMQSDFARLYHEHVLVKEPGTAEETPWHHDQPYYGVDGDQLCSIWVPLDVVPRRICPQFVAASHADGKLYYPRMFVDHEDYSAGDDGFESVPDIDARRDDYEILSWGLQPGDCIVFHMRTVHAAAGTLGIDTRRRGFSARWLGEDARFATRPWTTSPPFPEVRLRVGEEMEHPAFPVLWRASV